MVETTQQLILDARTFLGNVWKLARPYWFSEDKWMARGLLAAIVGMNLFLVYMEVQFNKWNNRFYSSLQERNYDDFKVLLLYFCFLAAVFIAVAVYSSYLNSMLQIRWRRWLTDVYLKEYLADRVYYRLELDSHGTDNPDQRIAEDLKLFAAQTLSLSLGFMNAVVTLVSFLAILWGLSGVMTIPIGDGIAIPGYMVWVAFLYALFGTTVTYVLGRPLIKLNFDQERFEANFRYGLIRLRENAEGVALYGGEADERRGLFGRFADIWRNWWGLMIYTKRLQWFTIGYNQVAVIFPIVVAAPRYFSGAVQLGVLTQTAGAFGQVQSSLSWFISAYTTLASWKASVDRLTTFHEAIQKADEEARSEGGIEVVPGPGEDLRIENLNVGLPQGRSLLAGVSETLRQGEHTIITGPSGAGKSTLFRAISGIWPYGQGQVLMPAGKRMLFLPQRPYLPVGSLRDAVAYPFGMAGISDDQIREALIACRLGEFQHRLDEVHNWSRSMSPGEQQRLAFARALVHKPDWLFLDEATSAVDESTEAHLYQLLRERLPGTTVVSIAHKPELAAFHDRRIRFENEQGRMALVAEPLASN